MKYVLWVMIEGNHYNGMHGKTHIVRGMRNVSELSLGVIDTWCGREAGIVRTVWDADSEEFLPETCKQCLKKVLSFAKTTSKVQ